MVPIPDPDPGSPVRNCLQGKGQQKILWADVMRKTGRGKDRFRIRDLFAERGAAR